jgi:hypothetical protein
VRLPTLAGASQTSRSRVPPAAIRRHIKKLAVKGTALLVVAAVAAMILRRDSAATRHLVWLLAMVAMLIVPVLSATLPRWRVLPE